MLKINLLPTKREAKGAVAGDTTTVFVVALVGTLLVLVAGLAFFHRSKSQDVARARDANNAIENQIRATRARVADHDRIRQDLDEIHAREDAISHLEAARTGPTSMLVELSHILSPGGRPAADPDTIERIQRDNPTEMYNSTWDPHRLWLQNFHEENRDVEMEGAGRTPDDVGEFMRRMMLSQYFEQVRLERSEGSTDEGTKIAVQRFKIGARVRY
jgi:type IV pilus assembly protein PilN